MRMLVPKQIGDSIYNFEVEGDTLHAVVMESQKLSFPDVKSCGLCESNNLYLTAYITKDGKYEYVKIVCRKCKGSLTFGQRKDQKDAYFLRRREDRRLDWQAIPDEMRKPERKEVQLDEPPVDETDSFSF